MEFSCEEEEVTLCPFSFSQGVLPQDGIRCPREQSSQHLPSLLAQTCSSGLTKRGPSTSAPAPGVRQLSPPGSMTQNLFLSGEPGRPRLSWHAVWQSFFPIPPHLWAQGANTSLERDQGQPCASPA